MGRRHVKGCKCNTCRRKDFKARKHGPMTEADKREYWDPMESIESGWEAGAVARAGPWEETARTPGSNYEGRGKKALIVIGCMAAIVGAIMAVGYATWQ